MKSLTQKLNDEVARQYARRRNDAYQRRDERVERLYRLFPELETLDRKLRVAGLDRLQATLDGGRGQDGAFDRVERDRRTFLIRQGIEDGYDLPDYACRACGDTGRLGEGWCPCRRQVIQELLPAYFPDVMDRTCQFAHFNLNLFSDRPQEGDSEVSARSRMADHLQMAQFYTGHFERLQDRNLFFSGGPGTGKTFLMQCIGHRLMDEGHSVAYLTAPNLFELMTRYKRQKSAFRPDPDLLEESGMLFSALATWDLLLIDDLGTEPATSETYAQLILLLDGRQSRKLATIIASNIEVPDFSRLYDGRVASRLNGNFLKYEFIGDDVRLRRKNGPSS